MVDRLELVSVGKIYLQTMLLRKRERNGKVYHHADKLLNRTRFGV
jgi:hypothetical protein